MSKLAVDQPSREWVASKTDDYPSRTGHNTQLIGRRDPVVYAAENQIPPVDRSLIDSYAEQGFVVLDNVFTADEIAIFQQELELLRHDEKIQQSGKVISESNSTDVRSIFQVHESSAVFRELSADKRLVDLARYLLADEVYIHQSRLNYKPGFRGKEFYWHSDFETWHVEDGMPCMRALSMSIALTENFDSNGPLLLIPGSHKQYVACEGKTPENHYLSSLKKQEYGVPPDDSLEMLAAQGGIVIATGKPGSVTVFDCNVMHGSNGNITPFPRSNAFFVYNAVSNKVVRPFSGQVPRPEHICTRKNIKPVPRLQGFK